MSSALAVTLGVLGALVLWWHYRERMREVMREVTSLRLRVDSRSAIDPLLVHGVDPGPDVVSVVRIDLDTGSRSVHVLSRTSTCLNPKKGYVKYLRLGGQVWVRGESGGYCLLRPWEPLLLGNRAYMLSLGSPSVDANPMP